MAPLSWRHQTLIQTLLSRGPLKEDDFRSVFSQVIGKSSGSHQQLFDDYLRKINTELGYVQLELRACRNQYDGRVYYGVVNNVSDEQSQLGTKYTVPQIAFYKGIVEAIIQDADASGCISNIGALNIRLETQNQGTADSESQGGPSQIHPQFKNFSMSQKEKTLELLFKDQWLSAEPGEKIGIGVRSFLDLRSWFRTNEVPTCEVCNEAAVKAQLCKNEACNVRLHQYCLEKKFSQRKVAKVCPGCGTQWPGLSVKSEAVETLADQDVPSQNTQPRERSVKRRRRVYREDHDDVAEGPVSSPPLVAVSNRRRTTRSSARLSGN